MPLSRHQEYLLSFDHGDRTWVVVPVTRAGPLLRHLGPVRVAVGEPPWVAALGPVVSPPPDDTGPSDTGPGDTGPGDTD